MRSLKSEACALRAKREITAANAAQRAALQILCGISLESALDTSRETRDAIVQRIQRALRCERVKGLHRHWSYDLNRHIALKQAFDRLRTQPD